MYRNLTLSLVAACLIVPLVAHADEPRFALSDLEALDKQESWHELLVHAGDVAPAQRTDKWNQMIERAALGVLASHQAEADDAWSFADSVLRQYPQLKKSKKFMPERAKVGLHGLEACLHRAAPEANGRPGKQDPAVCVDRAVAFVEAEPDADTGLAMGKMIARQIQFSGVRVYKVALAARHTQKDCSDQLLGRTVGDALGLSADDSRVADAKAIAADLCWDGIKDAIVDRFISDRNRDFRKNACPFLLAKKDALSAMSRKQCEEALK